jgi:hypothetical protein
MVVMAVRKDPLGLNVSIDYGGLVELLVNGCRASTGGKFAKKGYAGKRYGKDKQGESRYLPISCVRRFSESERTEECKLSRWISEHNCLLTEKWDSGVSRLEKGSCSLSNDIPLHP